MKPEQMEIPRGDIHVNMEASCYVCFVIWLNFSCYLPKYHPGLRRDDTSVRVCRGCVSVGVIPMIGPPCFRVWSPPPPRLLPRWATPTWEVDCSHNIWSGPTSRLLMSHGWRKGHFSSTSLVCFLHLFTNSHIIQLSMISFLMTYYSIQ